MHINYMYIYVCVRPIYSGNSIFSYKASLFYLAHTSKNSGVNDELMANIIITTVQPPKSEPVNLIALRILSKYWKISEKYCRYLTLYVRYIQRSMEE